MKWNAGALLRGAIAAMLVMGSWACDGGDGDDGDASGDVGGGDSTDTSAEANVGLGCECNGESDCATGFCSTFSVCTTNDQVECQSDQDCGCKARCIVNGPSRTCQIPCASTADCPGSLECASLAAAWTTANGDTVLSGCLAPSEPAAITWTQHIQPIVNSACAGCHTGGASSGGVNFDAYANTQMTVSDCPSGTPKLLAQVMAEKVSPTPPCGGRMPLTGGPLSDAQVKLFSDWVQAGAPE